MKVDALPTGQAVQNSSGKEVTPKFIKWNGMINKIFDGVFPDKD